MDNQHPLLDAIAEHRREYDRRLRRIRDDAELNETERRAALSTAYDRAVARHRELVAALEAATTQEARGVDDDGDEAPQGADFMNALIRGEISTPSAGDRLAENFVLRNVDRPSEVAER